RTGLCHYRHALRFAAGTGTTLFHQNFDQSANDDACRGLFRRQAGRLPQSVGRALLDPSIGRDQPSAQRCRGLPAEHGSQPRIVAVAPTHALRTRGVVALHQPLVGNLRDDVDQTVDGHQFVGAEIEWRAVIRPHDAVNTFDAIINVHERSRLLPVTPNLDVAPVSERSYLAADRSR